MKTYLNVEHLFTLKDVAEGIVSQYCDTYDTDTVVKLEKVLKDVQDANTDMEAVHVLLSDFPYVQKFLSDLYVDTAVLRESKTVWKVLSKLTVSYELQSNHGSYLTYTNYFNVLTDADVERISAFPLPLNHILLRDTYRKYLQGLDKSDKL